jgi:uncharacterized membrane protein
MKGGEAGSETSPLFAAGLLLGAGLGGFLDGIVFHQILQTHNMLSAVVPRTSLVNAEVNMFWDGLFHALVWGMTVLGLYRLWRAGARPDVAWSGEVLVGSMSMGWGLFNTVEGLVDHHVLGVHHVVEALGLSAFDWAFLGSGLVLIAGGWALVRRGAHRTAPRAARA